MLNLSDKDLDRLTQEAAQQYEPENVGPKLWEKLEARLDRDLGKVNLNPARGIRRLPYYYAPILLVILGAGFYFARLAAKSSKGMSSASPPVSVLPQAAAGKSNATNSTTNSTTNPVQTDRTNATQSLSPNTVPYPGSNGNKDAAAGPAPSAANPSNASPSAATPSAASPSAATPSPASPSPAAPSPFLNKPTATPSTATAPVPARDNHLGNNSYAATKPGSRNNLSPSKPGSARNIRSQTQSVTSPDAGSTTNGGAPQSMVSAQSPATNRPGHNSQAAGTPQIAATPAARIRELTFSPVRGPMNISGRPVIDDSALRAFNLAASRDALDLTASARQNHRKDGLHVNNALVFGLMGGPDFASVNSVGGAKAGSSFGLTVDYQFANHWYLGSGLLYTQKVFAAAPQDYHVPQGYYSQNGMGMGMSSDVRWINGRFQMLEIPLNVRFDFNATGNTAFFVSAGASSYLFTSENCGYSYSFYNRIESKQFTYGNHPDNLFSTINLSVGVEAGISNTLSVLVSPYVKIPTRNIGFGQVQLNSFGLDFALRFAPVISRSRH